MKSNVCKIDNGTKDLAAILNESERVAEYNNLTHKQAMQLRLICEEIDGMLPNIIDEFSGELWIEFEKNVCKVNISLNFDEFTAEKKKELVSVAKNKKNAAATGIVGKIRSAIENVFLDSSNYTGFDLASESYHFSSEYYNFSDRSYLWSLDQYRTTVKMEKRAEDWDELEKSVLASVADDVIVGVKGKQADIVIIKNFG